MSTELALAITDDKLPAHVAKGTGRGNEDVTADQLTIPRLKLLQKMNDEVDKHHGNYVEGAEVGDFMNSLTKELFGTEVYVISIKFKDEYVIWRKREAGGGYLGSFSSMADAQERIAQEEKPDDYDINQTHSHIMLIKNPKTGELSTPIIMDFASSKLRVSRNWNTQINMKGGDRFAGLWKLSSVQTENKAGATFMNLDASFVGWAQEADYKVAEEIYEQFAQ